MIKTEQGKEYIIVGGGIDAVIAGNYVGDLMTRKEGIKALNHIRKVTGLNEEVYLAKVERIA